MNEIDKSIEIAIENNIKEIRGTKRSAANLSPLTPLSPEEMRLVMERNPEFLMCETPKNSGIKSCIPRNLKNPERGEGELDKIEISATEGLMNDIMDLQSEDNEDGKICKECCVDIEVTDLVLKCDLCSSLSHYLCASIDSKEYIKIKSLKGKIRWFCDACDTKVFEMKEDNEILTATISAMKVAMNQDKSGKQNETPKINNDDEQYMSETADEPSYNVLKLDILNEVTTKMNNVCKILSDKIDQDLIKVNEGHEMVLYYLKKFQGIKSVGQDRTSSGVFKSQIQKPNDDSDKVNGKEVSNIDYNQEQNDDTQQLNKENEANKDTNEETEKKKDNLILYNVPESKSQDPKQRVEDDLDICEDIIYRELQIDNVNIFKIIRLGKKDENKMRPLLIKVTDTKEKWYILGKAKNLRDSEKYSKIFISKDMTIEERQKDKELRAELKERKENGEDCLIKNGRVVKRRNVNLGDYVIEQRHLRNNRGLRGRREN